MTKPFLIFLLFFGSSISSGCLFSGAEPNHAIAGKYQCLPCGSNCDKRRFDASGECPDCGMKLVEAATVTFGTVEPADICRYIKEHPGVVLLDVRTKNEFEGKADPNYGALKGAFNIPIQELESRMGELAAFKEKEIIVYCSHSHRSPRASYLLTQNGFTQVKNMAGGMSVLGKVDCLK